MASARTVHLGDQILALLAATSDPLTTPAIHKALACTGRLSTETARVLAGLERGGQVAGHRSTGRYVLWSLAAGACTLTVELLEAKLAAGQDGRRP